MAKVVVTYSEFLEGTALIAWKKLKEDRELRKIEQLDFYKPRKEELLDVLYQRKFCKAFVEANLLKGKAARKLAEGENLSKAEWETLRKEWVRLWNKNVGQEEILVLPKSELFKLASSSKKFYATLGGIVFVIWENVRKFHKNRLRIALKRKRSDILVDLHAGLSYSRKKWVRLVHRIEYDMGLEKGIESEKLKNILEKHNIDYPPPSCSGKITNVIITTEIFTPKKKERKSWFLPRPIFIQDCFLIPKLMYSLVDKDAAILAYKKLKPFLIDLAQI